MTPRESPTETNVPMGRFSSDVRIVWVQSDNGGDDRGRRGLSCCAKSVWLGDSGRSRGYWRPKRWMFDQRVFMLPSIGKEVTVRSRVATLSFRCGACPRFRVVVGSNGRSMSPRLVSMRRRRTHLSGRARQSSWLLRHS